MKLKLTKAQKAKAKRAVLAELREVYGVGLVSSPNDLIYSTSPEWPEVERLLKVALRAVRGA